MVAESALPDPDPGTAAEPAAGVAGRVCVITGASSGIGKAAAVALAGLGANVILVCRDRSRGEAARAEVARAATGAEPSLELADLSSLEQVRDVAAKLASQPAVHVLINNAGLVIGTRQLTADGLECTFALNHLAPFLLTNLLLPKLQSGAPARVVTVASAAHRGARLDLTDLQAARRYVPMQVYGNSKLANILFTRELARRTSGTGVTANCLHPGTVRTNFGSTGSPLLKLGIALGTPFFRTPESGAGTVVYLAAAPEVAALTGGYYINCKLREPSAAARDDDLGARLWSASAELTGAG